jgi:hypothetical protein
VEDTANNPVIPPTPTPALNEQMKFILMRGGGTAIPKVAVGCSTKDGARQGAGVAELLAVFDAMRMEHADMAAEAFNDDGAYKTCINQVIGRTPLPPFFSLASPPL